MCFLEAFLIKIQDIVLGLRVSPLGGTCSVIHTFDRTVDMVDTEEEDIIKWAGNALLWWQTRSGPFDGSFAG